MNPIIRVSAPASPTWSPAKPRVQQDNRSVIASQRLTEESFEDRINIVFNRQAPTFEEREGLYEVLDRHNQLITAVEVLENLGIGVNAQVVSRLLKKKCSWKMLKCLFFAIPRSVKNVHHYNFYISEASEQGKVKSIKKVFQEAKDLELTTTETSNSYIDAMGKNGHLIEAQEEFEEIDSLGRSDTTSYDVYIDALGKNGRPELAIPVFKKAREWGIAKIKTYNIYMTAMGKNGHFEQAREAFEEAKKLDIIDEVSFIIFINVAAKNGQFEAGESAFEESIKRRLVTDVSRSNFIDMLVDQKQFTKAEKIFNQSSFELKWCYERGGKKCVDLHRRSYGIGFLFALKHAQEAPFTMITGKGLSRRDGNLYILRERLRELIQEHSSTLEIGHTKNEGRLKIIKKSQTPALVPVLEHSSREPILKIANRDTRAISK